MNRTMIVAGAMLAALSLAACGEDTAEIEVESDDGATMSDVREDAAALAESTGEMLKDGMGELKEGAEDVGQMMKDAGAEMKEAVDAEEK